MSTALGRGKVLGNHAVWNNSEVEVAQEIDAGPLALVPVDTRDTWGPVGLTTRVGTALSTPAEALADTIRAVAARSRGDAT